MSLLRQRRGKTHARVFPGAGTVSWAGAGAVQPADTVEAGAIAVAVAVTGSLKSVIIEVLDSEGAPTGIKKRVPVVNGVAQTVMTAPLEGTGYTMAARPAVSTGAAPAVSAAFATTAAAVPNADELGAFGVASGPLEPFTVTVRNESDTNWTEGAISFAHAFHKGALPAGEGLQVTVDSTSHWAQIDVLNTWSDGSVNNCTIALRRPAMTAHTGKTFTLAAGTPPAATDIDVAALLADKSMSVEFASASFNGTAATLPALDLKQKVLDAIQAPDTGADTPTYFQKGPHLTTVCLRITDHTTAQQSSGMTFYADVSIDWLGNIHFDFNPVNDRIIRAPTPEMGRFDAIYTAKINGATKWTQEVWTNLRKGWSLEAYSGPPLYVSALDGLNIHLPVEVRAAGGLVPPYDSAITPTEASLANAKAITDANPNFMRPLYTNDFAPGVEGTDFGSGSGGHHPDKGPMTDSCVAYLLSGDVRVLRRALGISEIAMSMPVYLWDETHHRYLDRSYYKRIESDLVDPAVNLADPMIERVPVGGVEASTLTGTDPAGSYMSADDQHTPSSLYASGWVLTGRPRFHRAVMANAAFTMTMFWNANFNRDPYYTSDYDILVHTNAVANWMGPDTIGWQAPRTIAWTSLSWDSAYNLARTGSHPRAYWREVWDRNLDAFNRAFPAIVEAQGGTGSDSFAGKDYCNLGRVYAMWQHGYMVQCYAQHLLRRYMDEPDGVATQHFITMFKHHAGYYLKFGLQQSGLKWQYAFIKDHPVQRQWAGFNSGGWGSEYSDPEMWYKDPDSLVTTCTEEAAILGPDSTWFRDPVPPDGLVFGIISYDDPNRNLNQITDTIVHSNVFGCLCLCYRVAKAIGDADMAADFLTVIKTVINAVPAMENRGTSLANMREKMINAYTLGSLGLMPFTNEHYSRGETPPAAPEVNDPGPLGAPDGARVGAVLATLTASTITSSWAISSQNPAGACAIDALGRLTVADAAAFNIGQRASITVDVVAHGDGGDSTPLTLTLTLNDGKPIVPATTFSIQEHAPTATPAQPLAVDTVIGTLAAANTGAADVSTWDLASQSAAGAVKLGTPGLNTVPLLVADPTQFDVETAGSLTADVTATNSRGTSAPGRISVLLRNVVEPGDPAPMLLDELSIPHSDVLRAYALHRLFNGYNGPCIRVYNSGGTGLDVGFDGSGLLDWAAVAAHVGAAQAEIELYCQQTGTLLKGVAGIARPTITDASGNKLLAANTTNGRATIGVEDAHRMLQEKGIAIPGNEVAAITAWCNVPNWFGDMLVLVSEPDGAGDAKSVRALIYQQGQLGTQRWGTPLYTNVTADSAHPYILTGHHGEALGGRLRLNGVEMSSYPSGMGPFGNPLTMNFGARSTTEAPGGGRIGGVVLLMPKAGATRTDFTADIATVEAGLRTHLGF